MQFCPKCGTLMMPKKTEGVTSLVCSSCGYVAEGGEIADDYKMVRRHEKGEGITVIEEEAAPALPTTKVRCPACGHVRAYWWLRQTRSADEPTTRFYRCAKCGKVWREYA